MKKNKALNMKNLMEDINRTSKLLKSSYIFEDYGMNPQGEEMIPQDGEMNQDMVGQVEMEPEIDEQTVDVINQIRELAIQGIAQFANDVESEQYRALKRIWLETDKFYESINGDNDKK